MPSDIGELKTDPNLESYACGCRHNMGTQSWEQQGYYKVLERYYKGATRGLGPVLRAFRAFLCGSGFRVPLRGFRVVFC